MYSWQAHQVRWSPDGSMIAMVDLVDGYFAVWNTSDGSAGRSQASRPTTPHSSPSTRPSARIPGIWSSRIRRIRLADGRGRSNALSTISTTDWRVEATRDLPADAEQLMLVGTTTDPSTLIAVSGLLGLGDTALHWFNPITLADLRAPRTRLHDTEMDAVALGPDGALVATGAADGSIRVWDRRRSSWCNEIAIPWYCRCTDSRSSAPTRLRRAYSTTAIVRVRHYRHERATRDLAPVANAQLHPG